MKKNKMMRLASAMMVMTLMTTSVISGTFAKYVTTNDANDSARVAKWGIVLQADGTLYGNKYVKGVIDISEPTTDETVANLSVIAKDNANVVAPGTRSDSGLNFSINGTPEVRSMLEATISVQNIYLTDGTYGVLVEAPTVTETSYKANAYYYDNGSAYVLDTSAAYTDARDYFTMQDKVTLGDTYYPVVYNADVTGDITEDTLNEIALDYATKLGYAGTKDTTPNADGKFVYEITKEYDPNFNYSSLGIENDTLTWKWDYEQASDKEVYDGADTILGNLMAGSDLKGIVVKEGTSGYVVPTAITTGDQGDYSLTTSFAINIKVTQVD